MENFVEELSRISQDLEEGTITDKESRTFLLSLLDVRCNFIDRYKKIIKSDWFKRAYKNKSMGDR